jgi:hypothetical protein
MQMDGEDSSCALHSTALLLCDNVCGPRIFCTSLVTCLVCTWHLLSHYLHPKREVLLRWHLISSHCKGGPRCLGGSFFEKVLFSSVKEFHKHAGVLIIRRRIDVRFFSFSNCISSFSLRFYLPSHHIENGGLKHGIHWFDVVLKLVELCFSVSTCTNFVESSIASLMTRILGESKLMTDSMV